MRDDEQHWFNEVSEQLLYLHARAGITLFDDLLQRVFGEHLADNLPSRVLPLSVDPPRDLTVLIDEEYSQIAALLAPGRRAAHEARARIRTLLALEAHVEPEARVSTKDVGRVEKGIKAGQSRPAVFPRLEKLALQTDGHGVNLTVHFTKKEGAPVRFVSDEALPAAAVREVDLARKFYLSARDLAGKVGLSGPRSTALRRHLGNRRRRELQSPLRLRLPAHRALLRQRVPRDDRGDQATRHGSGLGRSQAGRGARRAKKV
jgi:hypothetical protein